MSKKEKILLFILAAVQFIVIVDFMIMMPLGPQLMRIFDISPQQFGFLVSAYTFAAGISSLIGVFWVDLFDRKKVLLYSFAGLIVATFACALAPSYGFLMMARILTGIFGGIPGAVVFSIIGDVFEENKRGTASGYVATSFSLASVVGVPFGLFIASLSNWHAPFFLLCGFGLVILFMIFKFVPRIKTHLKHKTDDSKIYDSFVYIIKNSNLRLALLFIAALVMGQFTIVPFISPYMSSNIGFTDAELSLIYLVGGAATIITSPKIGKLADKYGKPKIFTIMGFLSLIPIVAVTNMPKVGIPIALIFTTLVFVFFSGRFVPATAYITSVVSAKYRGSFMSFNFAFMQITSGIASIIAGMIITKSPDGQLLNYPYVGLIAVVFTFIAMFMIRKVKQVNNSEPEIKITNTSETKEIILQE